MLVRIYNSFRKESEELAAEAETAAARNDSRPTELGVT